MSQRLNIAVIINTVRPPGIAPSTSAPLGIVQRIEPELRMVAVGHDLDAEFPFGVVAALDGVIQVLGRMADVLRLDFRGLRRGQIAHALLGLPVELDEMRHALIVHQLVGIDARSFHFTIVGRNAPWTLDPGDHVQCFRCLRDEVLEAPWSLPVGDRVGLEGMDHVRKLDCIADEKYLQVVADQIPVAIHGLELDGKAARVACGFRRILAADDGGKPDKDGRAHTGFIQHFCPGVLGCRLIADLAIGFEIAICARAAGMHHAFRNAFAVEIRDHFSELIVFQCGRAAFANRAQ